MALTIVKQVQLESEPVSADLISLHIIECVVHLRALEFVLAAALDAEVLCLGKLVELYEERANQVFAVRLAVRDRRCHSVPKLDLKRTAERSLYHRLVSQVQWQQDGLPDVECCQVKCLHLGRLDLLDTATGLELGLVEGDEFGVVGLAEELELKEQ